MATRRTDDAKFDHGAQFYRLKKPLRGMHERWLERQLVKLWFVENGEQHFNAPNGMTALAKDLASDVHVILNERVTQLRRDGERWAVTFESLRTELTDEIIFTCPVPQTLEILKASSIDFALELKDVTYSKAIVLLIENSPSPFAFTAHGYIEPKSSSIFSIADQFEKGLSKTNALAVTLDAESSEKLFDSPEAEVITEALADLKKHSPGFEPGTIQIKKWRYCQVQKTLGELFTQVSPGVYLAGDGFGGASLNGAARSANALGEHLING